MITATAMCIILTSGMMIIIIIPILTGDGIMAIAGVMATIMIIMTPIIAPMLSPIL